MVKKLLVLLGSISIIYFILYSYKEIVKYKLISTIEKNSDYYFAFYEKIKSDTNIQIIDKSKYPTIKPQYDFMVKNNLIEKISEDYSSVRVSKSAAKCVSFLVKRQKFFIKTVDYIFAIGPEGDITCGLENFYHTDQLAASNLDIQLIEIEGANFCIVTYYTDFGL